MRPVFASLVAAGVLAGSLLTAPIASAQQCQQPKERSAFEVAGLKSQLMVIALTCDVREKFNAFVLRYRPVLMAGEKGLNTYFARAFGGHGQAAHDDYITQLANAQSSNGLQRGTLFCQENVGLFDEVLALHTAKQLMDFANEKPMLQPIDYDICGLPHHPVYQPTLVQASAATTTTTTASGQTVVAQQSASGTPQKRNFFGNIAHGIGSIF